jgi:hypothetical protein
MNPTSSHHWTAPRAWSLLLAAIVSCHEPAEATLSEPDNILYGSITLDNTPVTSARTDIVVEARRTLNGPAVASYRMGSNPRVGNFYSLEISLESVSVPLSPDASQTGDTLVIVVTDPSGVRAEHPYTAGERGQVLRVDFGSSIPDADGNGLPDLWELANFGATAQDPQAVNANGHTTLENFVAGTNPNDGTSRFQVNAGIEVGQRKVWFFARAAEGVGYAGMTRFYTLERSPDLSNGSWVGVPGFIEIPANNQTLIHQAPLTGPPAFYRGNVRLQGP